jgi:hypothetical protein
MFCNNRATMALPYVRSREPDTAPIARLVGNGFEFFAFRMRMPLRQSCCSGSSRCGVSSAAEAGLAEQAEVGGASVHCAHRKKLRRGNRPAEGLHNHRKISSTALYSWCVTAHPAFHVFENVTVEHVAQLDTGVLSSQTASDVAKTATFVVTETPHIAFSICNCHDSSP